MKPTSMVLVTLAAVLALMVWGRPVGVDRSGGASTARAGGTAAKDKRPRGPRGRRGPRGAKGPRGPAGPPGPSSHGAVRTTRSVDVTVPPGATAEGVAVCADDAAFISYVGALGGGAYFLGADPGPGAALTASYPGVSRNGTTAAARTGETVNAWVARATNPSSQPQTLRVFVACYGSGP